MAPGRSSASRLPGSAGDLSPGSPSASARTARCPRCSSLELSAAAHRRFGARGFPLRETRDLHLVPHSVCPIHRATVEAADFGEQTTFICATTSWAPGKKPPHPTPHKNRPSPLPTYARDGGLRQAPGHAAQSSAMTKHAVVIAGGGPTGLMLAAELALARVDVAIVERRAKPGPRRLARRRSAFTHDRGARSAWNRGSLPLAGEGHAGRGLRDDPSRHQRLSDSPQLRARAVAGAHRAHPRRLGRRAGGTDLSRT